ncbi:MULTISPECIES: GYDIA family GHMP kinase [Myroides]|uniref:GHMP kinase n=1 Tax=Myroides albus TaxID=2562892 RepID=A0A6I3LLV3_9FLAO|nr:MULTISPECIES: GYDIA family GHMP kinase [Myroides]MTG96965.1 GHMP kinase [Myroides albus]MVX35342.1 GHMP kinase [Myroides sp. LoEW2-1]UVD78283.1 GYDIA family GHMP kinase [Myroides albus]
MTKRFYSNGKLLLSGEYLVLEGALAFALPTKFGQSMIVKQTNKPTIKWVGLDIDGKKWIDEEISITDIKSNSTTTDHSTYFETLLQVLRAAHKQNSELLSQDKIGFEVITELTFPRLWGLGTSSTWINNIAQWFNINPYQLLFESFGGSGYDIACAQHNQGLYYTLTDPLQPTVELIDFKPIFADNLYFVYLNKKKDSKEAIAHFHSKKGNLTYEINQVSAISKEMSTTQSFVKFQTLIEEHENIMSRVLNTPTVKQELFSDFPGSIKSLGGWGGDFVLVAHEQDPKHYFQEKGYNTIVNYCDMIL